ncbi:restriction endonuclease [Streptomyces sp. URMC 128]|uniref:restriction endonuclease n=1 Tax=Streptomyces sp. URMC 128 TaxID=3423404 RepID=UPI003F1A49C0
MAQFLRKQVEISGKTLAALSKEMNFSKSILSANLAGAIPKPEFIRALILATEHSPAVRSSKLQQAMTLRGEAHTGRNYSALQSSSGATQQDLTQSLIRSLQDQIALERALRAAMQLNWALLWQSASGAAATTEASSRPIPDGISPDSTTPQGKGNQNPGGGQPSSADRKPTGSAPSSAYVERIVLHDLMPADFEAMVRDLFLAMGFTAWAESTSTDRGFDAVMINGDPVMGGSVLVQAKNVDRPVQVISVRGFAGVIEHERATKGVFVTTSHFTQGALEFAARSGRMELIDGRSLQSLLSEHLGMEVDL